MNSSLEREFGPRLTKLHTGIRGLREGLHIQASVPTDGCSEPAVDFISSDETLDRYNEIISASGWVLDSYLKNPVFQDSHDYSTVLRTIGKAVITEVRSGATDGNSVTHAPYLFQRIVFAVNENPLAKIAYDLYRGGFLSAVSVGFVPLEWEPGQGYTRRHLRQELLETSAVAIPANPNALELAFKSGAIGKSDLRELRDLLAQFTADMAEGQTKHLTCPQNHFCTSPAVSHTNTRALGYGDDEAQLVQLLREVAAICHRD